MTHFLFKYAGKIILYPGFVFAGNCEPSCGRALVKASKECYEEESGITAEYGMGFGGIALILRHVKPFCGKCLARLVHCRGLWIAPVAIVRPARHRWPSSDIAFSSFRPNSHTFR